MSKWMPFRRRRGAVLVAASTLTIGIVGGCVYNTPAVGHGSEFSAVATVSRNDVWAVGSYQDGAQHPHALIEHFDGHAWSIVPAPAEAGTRLGAITAISATNIYAVGDNTLHWNGQRWGVVTDTNGYVLTSIAHSPTGVLVGIGYHGSGSPDVVLMHTGAGWTPLSTPAPPLPNAHGSCGTTSLYLTAITLLSASDVWVGGLVTDAAGPLSARCAYVAHWDGGHWTVPSVPNGTGNAGTVISSLSARGPHDVWAVGSSTDFPGPGERFESDNGYVVRWNGTTWQKLCNSGCGPDWGAIDATGTSVWVVGGTVFPQDPFTPVQMEIDRWSGNGWVRQAVQTIKPPSEGIPVNTLVDVSVHDGLVVSVGSFLTNDQRTPLPLVDQRPDR